MKAVFGVLVASLSLVAGAAQAASVNNNAPSKTRAQVVTELHQAQAQGLISQNRLDYPVSLPAAEHKTRQQVLTELASAESAGQISTSTLDYPVESAAAAPKARSEVVAELVTYKTQHPYVNTVNNS